MSLLDYWPTTGIIRELNGTNTDGESGGGEEGSESMLSGGGGACTNCGFGGSYDTSGQSPDMGAACPVCGEDSVVSGDDFKNEFGE